MKLLFIISSLSNGGAEKILTLIANNFSYKDDVYVIMLSKHEPFYALEKKVTLIKLNLYQTSHSAYEALVNNAKRIITLRKTIKSIQPDIIISFLTQTNIISIIATIFLNIPIIIAERSIYDTENNNKFWKLLRKVIYPFSDILILLTKDDEKNYNFIANKVVIPNFITISEPNDNLKKENFILAVGRLHPVKQFDKLIKIYSKLNTNYKLLIVGDGKERERLEQLIKTLKLEDKISLEGQRKNIYDYYKKAKIFVLTSKHEAFPNVILEALYFGCAVVSFDCDYGPRVIIEDKKNGFLVNSEEEFVKKINMLISNQTLLEKISYYAKERAKDFEQEKIIQKWENIIYAKQVK